MIRRLLLLTLLLLAPTLAACSRGQPVAPTVQPAPTATAVAAPSESPPTASPRVEPELLRQQFAPSPGGGQSLLGASQLDRLLAEQGVAVRSSVAPSHGAAIDALCSGEASFVWLTAHGYLAAQERCPDLQLLFAVDRASGAASADATAASAPDGAVAAGAAVAAEVVQTTRAALAAAAASAEGRAALDAIGGWGNLSEAGDDVFDPLRATLAAAGITDLAAWRGVSQPLRVGLVTDGGRIDDGSLNQGAYQGMEQAAAAFDLELNFIESVQPGDLESNIATLANAGYDLIITVGPAMAEATQKLAERYPAARFALVDAAIESAPDNLRSIVFREDQAGFLAGALAGQISQSQTVGVVTGPETPAVSRYRGGFANGVASACPTCQVITVSIDSASDPARGKTAALSQIAEGADVIFGVGGATGSGAVQGAAQDGAWAIGAELDAYLATFGGGAVNGAQRLLTSAIKRADVAVYAAIADVVMGRFQGGAAQFDASNSGIGLAPFRDAAASVPADVQAQLLETLQALASGALDTGVAPATGDQLP